MDNTTPIRVAQPPTLIELLNDMRQQLVLANVQLTQMTSRLDRLEAQQTQLSVALAKRRLPRGPVAFDPDKMLPDVVKTLERFWESNRMPMPVYYLARLYTRQISASGKKFIDIIAPLADKELKIISTATGSMNIVLLRVWNEATQEKRIHWQGATTKELVKERQVFRDAVADGLDGVLMPDGSIKFLNDEAPRPSLTSDAPGDKSSAEGNTP